MSEAKMNVRTGKAKGSTPVVGARDSAFMTERAASRDGRRTTHAFQLHGGLSASFAVGLGLVVAIEGVLLHLWIAARSQPWAWTIAALNGATLAWLGWEYKSAAQGRLVVGADGDVEIDAGSRLRCRFNRRLIASAESVTWRSVPSSFTQGWANTAEPLEPNVVVTLREPISAKHAFVIRTPTWKIGLRVDDAEAVCKALLE